MFTPHMETTCKLALVGLKMQRRNPCGVVRNYFDHACKMEFVACSAQTLSLLYVNSFMRMYACSVSLEVIVTLLWSVSPLCYTLHPLFSSSSSILSPFHSLPPSLSHYQAMCCLHSFPFSSNRATGAGGLEITCAVLCFRPDTVINHCPSHTSTYNNKDWLLCGGCRPIAFHCADAKLEVNGHSQTLLPCPQTVSSFRYLSISALSVVLLPALPRGLRLLGGGSDLLLGLFGFDSVPIS